MGRCIVSLLLLAGILFSLPVTAAAAGATGGTQKLVIEKQVTAPKGHEALADRYQFTLALWNTDPIEAKAAKYTVNYYKGSVARENFVGSLSGSGEVGTTIPRPNLSLHTIEGYKTPGAVAAGSATVISENEARNVVNVVYPVKPLTEANYTVHYYTGSISGENLIDTVYGTGEIGSAIPYDVGRHNISGYQTPGWVASGSASMISADEASNVVYIVYPAISIPPPQLFEYSVVYYRESLVDFSIESAGPTVTGSGTLGSTIPYVENLYWPGAGYGGTSVSGATTITVDASANVVTITYKRTVVNAPWPGIGSIESPGLRVGTGSIAQNYTATSSASGTGAKRPQPIPDVCLASLVSVGHDIVKLDDSDNCAMYKFTLAHGQTLDIYGLPDNTGFTVTEVRGVKTGLLDLDSVTVTLSGAGSQSTTKQMAGGMLVRGNAKAVFHYVRPGKITVDPDKPTPGGKNPGPPSGKNGNPTGNGATGTGRPVRGVGDIFSRVITGDVPLGGFAIIGSWSLLNLLLALLGIVCAIVLFLHYVITVRGRKKAKDKDPEDIDEEDPTAEEIVQTAELAEGGAVTEDLDEDDTDNKVKKRWQVLRWIAVAAGPLQVLLFLILEDIRLPMVWVTRWTPLFVLVTIVQLACILVFAAHGGMMRNKDEDEDDEDQNRHPELKDAQSVLS